MKTVWKCTWEVVPGDGEHMEQFPTFAAAKLAMWQKIARHIDLREYLADLEPQVAAFLGRYLSDPQFPGSAEDIPGDYEDPERGELYLDADSILWKHPCGAYPQLDTNLVLAGEDDEDYYFHFWYAYPQEATGHGARGLDFLISPRVDYGTSAYPLMVLLALREYPQTQEQIIHTISDTWDTAIDRKAVGRHLQLLQDLGYPVQHGPDGYYYDGDPGSPKPDVKFTPSAYPFLILQALDGTPKTKTAIIHAVQEKIGVKIDRKAVGRNLELLDVFGYSIQKSSNGYYFRWEASQQAVTQQ